MTDTTSTPKPESVPFYPDHVRTEARVVLGILVVVFIVGTVGMLWPVGLGAPADPMDTPAHVKPEWYFLALYQILKFIPKTLGATLPVLLVLLVILWPFLDQKIPHTRQAIRVRFVVTIVGLVLAIALTIWGEVS
jgi:cytochrome b6-f complex subunit 4